VNYACLKTLEVLIVLVEHKCAKDTFILNLDKTDNFVLKRFYTESVKRIAKCLPVSMLSVGN
jgi:hypothetical protein